MSENKKGFTLAELLIVVAIISVLVAVSIPTFSQKLEKSRQATDVANARAIKSALVTAYTDGTIEFREDKYYGNKTCVVVYATKDAVSYFSTGTTEIDGKTWKEDSFAYERVKNLIEQSGISADDCKVHSQNKMNTGWESYRVILYSDGVCRIVSSLTEMNFDKTGNRLEASVANALPPNGSSNMENAIYG